MQKNERRQLRRPILHQRSLLSLSERQHASKIISQRLAKTILFIRSKRIAFYFANKGEVDTSLLLKKALSLGKECYLPILHPVKHNQMWFGSYKLGDPLTKNSFGILEPTLESAQQAPAWSLDLVLTPLVAFDDKGNRLGMGGGFYDRTFSFLQNTMKNKPKLIGLAYDFQQLPEIHIQAWDIPLDFVITETNVYYFKG